MATSRCSKCESSSFEMKEGKIKDCNYRMMFVQCASCGAVLGVTEYFNVSANLLKLADKLGIRL